MMRYAAMFLVYFWPILAGVAILAYEKPLMLATMAACVVLWLALCSALCRGR